jgi:GT2 family glycosyltransferase
VTYKTHIIIVSYNAMPWLDKCLESIDFSRYEVVVVDNCSSDGTVAHVHKNYSAVKLFEENQNLGFGQANNIGISYALNQGAEHVFLLNQDAYLVGDALEQLVGFQKQNPEFGILSAIHTDYEISLLDPSFSKYMSHEKNPNFYSDYVLGNDLQSVYEVPFINAAGWLISKNCLKIVGGFDPIFFHYGEDTNYCQRVLYHQLKIGVIPSVYMAHYHTHMKIKKEKLSLKKIYDNYERYIKTKYADVNIHRSIKEENKKIILKLIISILILKFRNVKQSINFIKIIRKVKSDVVSSKQLNRVRGPKYLIIKK